METQNKSARFTKDAANRQGQGAYNDFSIPAGFRSQVCKVQFTLIPVDNISEGDYRVYIYDKTNSALIQPTPYQIPGLVANTPYTFSAEFLLSIPDNCVMAVLKSHS